MTLIALVGLSLLASAPLVAWRWHLTERRFEVTHKAEVRDETLASHEPRIKALEERVKSLEYGKAFK